MRKKEPESDKISMAEAAAMYLNGQITIDQWYNFGRKPKPQENK